MSHQDEGAMFRFFVFLIGTSVIAAVFAGIYYAPENQQARVEGSPAFNLAPGEVRQDGLGPTIPETPIVVTIEVLSGTVDLYVMDKEWAGRLPQDFALSLQAPFSYYQDLSATHVNSSHEFTLISDGATWHSLVFDNSDNYYDGDAASNETAQLKVTVRYIEDEERSLLLGYFAAAPSVLLVVLTFGRQWLRRRRQAEP